MYMTWEVSSKNMDRLKAGLRNSPAMSIFKAQEASLVPCRLGLSPDRAVGLDRPELKPLEKVRAFDEGGSPDL
jgi:hypothetical protein